MIPEHVAFYWLRFRAHGVGCLPGGGADQWAAGSALPHGARGLLESGRCLAFLESFGYRERAAEFLLHAGRIKRQEDRRLEQPAEDRSDGGLQQRLAGYLAAQSFRRNAGRSEEHTSELQSLRH